MLIWLPPHSPLGICSIIREYTSTAVQSTNKPITTQVKREFGPNMAPHLAPHCNEPACRCPIGRCPNRRPAAKPFAPTSRTNPHLRVRTCSAKLRSRPFIHFCVAQPDFSLLFHDRR